MRPDPCSIRPLISLVNLQQSNSYNQVGGPISIQKWSLLRGLAISTRQVGGQSCNGPASGLHFILRPACLPHQVTVSAHDIDKAWTMSMPHTYPLCPDRNRGARTGLWTPLFLFFSFPRGREGLLRTAPCAHKQKVRTGRDHYYYYSASVDKTITAPVRIQRDSTGNFRLHPGVSSVRLPPHSPRRSQAGCQWSYPVAWRFLRPPAWAAGQTTCASSDQPWSITARNAPPSCICTAIT